MSTIVVPPSEELYPYADENLSVHGPINELIAGANDGDVIEFQPVEWYQLDKPIVVEHKADIHLRFRGSTIFTVTAEPYEDPRFNRSRSHIQVNSSEHVRISGVNIRGTKRVTDGYRAALEAQHGVDIRSSSGVAISDLTVNGVWGDGVYASRNGYSKAQSVDVEVARFGISNVGRHLFGLASVDGFYIHDGWGSQPRHAILDLEPAGTQGVVHNVVMERATFGGGGLFFVASVGGGTVDGVAVQDVNVKGRGLQSSIGSNLERDPNAVRANFEFHRLTSDTQYAGNDGSVLLFHNVTNVNVSDITQPYQRLRTMQTARFYDCEGELLVDGETRASDFT